MRPSEADLASLIALWSDEGVRRALDAPAAEDAIERLIVAANVACTQGARGTAIVTEARNLALAIAEAVLGPDSRPASRSRRVIAQELQEQGRSLEADTLLAEDVAHLARRSPVDLQLFGSALYGLAYHRTYHTPDVEDGAAPLIERLRELMKRDPKVRKDLELLVTSLESEAARRTGDPERMVRAALADVDAIRRRVGSKHSDYAITVMNLGQLYTRLGRYAEAAQALSSARAIGTESDLERAILGALADLEEARGRPHDALDLLAAIERLWKKKLMRAPDDLLARRQRLQAMLQSTAGQANESETSTPMKMRHPKLGVGEVISRDGDKVRLRMEDGTERTFVAARLEPV